VVRLDETEDQEELVLGNVKVNLRTFGVMVRERAVSLTFHEFELLRLLCREVDRIVNYDSLCQSLWSSMGQKERRRLSVAICRLRVKLEASWPYRVETVRGRGYGFIATEA
jgi:two-component system, OmpR family, alkaline phosphatase synthesis response regulator PhoP